MIYQVGIPEELVPKISRFSAIIVRGAIAAFREQVITHSPKRPGVMNPVNPYKRKSFREAWDTGYHGFKQRKITVFEHPHKI